MKRTCQDCKQPVLVKNTACEHFDVATGEETYRCSACQKARVDALIQKTQESFGWL